MSGPAATSTAAAEKEDAGLAAILDSLAISPQAASRSTAQTSGGEGAPSSSPASSSSSSSSPAADLSRFANLVPSNDDSDDDDDDEDKSSRILPANQWSFLMYTNESIDCGHRRPIVLISRYGGWTEYHEAKYALERNGGFLPRDRWGMNDDPGGTFVFLRKDVVPLPILERALEKNKSIAYMLICGNHTWTEAERRAYFDAARADLQSFGCTEDVGLSLAVTPEEMYVWEPVPQQLPPA